MGNNSYVLTRKKLSGILLSLGDPGGKPQRVEGYRQFEHRLPGRRVHGE